MSALAQLCIKSAIERHFNIQNWIVPLLLLWRTSLTVFFIDQNLNYSIKLNTVLLWGNSKKTSEFTLNGNLLYIGGNCQDSRFTTNRVTLIWINHTLQLVICSWKAHYNFLYNSCRKTLLGNIYAAGVHVNKLRPLYLHTHPFVILTSWNQFQ